MTPRSRSILLLGSNGHAGLACCRSLGAAGHRVTILRFAAERTPADYSRFCSESLFIGSPDSGVREYIAKLTDLLQSGRYDYLIPADDLANDLVYSDYDAISLRTRVVGPTDASYNVVRNRYEAAAIAKFAGLVRPEAILVRRGQTPPPPSFPCVVRPVFSTAIIDDEPQIFSDRKVSTADEFDAKLRDDLPRVDVILQTPTTGTDVGLNFCAIDGSVLGAAVTLRRSSVQRDEVSPQTLSIIQNVARQLSWTGFMTLECKRTKDSLLFTEMLFNPWDSISLPIAAGVDFPKLLINGLEGTRSLAVALPIRTASARRVHVKSLLEDPLPTLHQFDHPVRRFRDRITRGLSRPFRGSGRTLAAASLQKTSSLLIVCQGNINRSVVAEHLFRASGFTSVGSAGLLGMSGRRPSKEAESFLKERFGIDISGVRSQSMMQALKKMGNIDLVVCFERKHIREIVRRFPSLRGRVTLLSQLDRINAEPADIADPHGAAPDVYLACFQRIEKLISELNTAGHLADPNP